MYQAILFAPDGDYVTDHEHETIEQVENALADQGSRWYFYPLEAVITADGPLRDSQRLVSVAEPLEHLKGRTIRTAALEIGERCAELVRAGVTEFDPYDYRQ